MSDTMLSWEYCDGRNEVIGYCWGKEGSIVCWNFGWCIWSRGIQYGEYFLMGYSLVGYYFVNIDLCVIVMGDKPGWILFGDIVK